MWFMTCDDVWPTGCLIERYTRNDGVHTFLVWGLTRIYTIILLISVGVRKRQVAILARSSREMSPTVRIV